MKSKVKIMHSILKVIYPRLVIVIISFCNWYLMKSKVKTRHCILKVIYARVKSKVKIRHSILKVIYPRGIFSEKKTPH